MQFLKRDLPTVNTYCLSVLQIWCQGLDTSTLELITETCILNWLLLKSILWNLHFHTTFLIIYLKKKKKEKRKGVQWQLSLGHIIKMNKINISFTFSYVHVWLTLPFLTLSFIHSMKTEKTWTFWWSETQYYQLHCWRN